MILLGKPRVQGSFPLSSNADEPTILVRVPPNAADPAEVTVTHPGTSGTIYLRWTETDTGTVTSTDRSIALEPKDSKTWRNPPRNCFLKALASASNMTADVDASWAEVDINEVPV